MFASSNRCKLQRALNAAARVVSGVHKFDRGLSRLLRTDLHWLDVSERVVCKLGVMAFNCLHGQAPPYLVLCQPVADVASRQHLWSATGQLLVVPRYRLSTNGRRAVWLVRRFGISSRRTCGGSGHWREQFQTVVEDVSICSVLMHPAH